jgi:hypothetical protein
MSNIIDIMIFIWEGEDKMADVYTDFDYEKEKLRVKSELENTKYDIEVLENNGTDYDDDINIDFDAFERHLDSDESKSLSKRIFGK